MKECSICRIIEGKAGARIVYNDDEFMAFLHPKPASEGHIVLVSKEHFPIIENFPDNLSGKIFNLASKISSSIFESMEVQGTNIFVQNGVPAGQTVPHVMVHIIPRKENDGLQLQWQPKQINEEEMSTVELKIKEDIDKTPSVVESSPMAESNKPAEVSEIKENGTKEENYLLKQLRRIP